MQNKGVKRRNEYFNSRTINPTCMWKSASRFTAIIYIKDESKRNKLQRREIIEVIKPSTGGIEADTSAGETGLYLHPLFTLKCV